MTRFVSERVAMSNCEPLDRRQTSSSRNQQKRRTETSFTRLEQQQQQQPHLFCWLSSPIFLAFFLVRWKKKNLRTSIEAKLFRETEAKGRRLSGTLNNNSLCSTFGLCSPPRSCLVVLPSAQVLGK